MLEHLCLLAEAVPNTEIPETLYVDTTRKEDTVLNRLHIGHSNLMRILRVSKCQPVNNILTSWERLMCSIKYEW